MYGRSRLRNKYFEKLSARLNELRARACWVHEELARRPEADLEWLGLVGVLARALGRLVLADTLAVRAAVPPPRGLVFWCGHSRAAQESESQSPVPSPAHFRAR